MADISRVIQIDECVEQNVFSYLDACTLVRKHFTKPGYDICNIEIEGFSTNEVIVKFKNVHCSVASSMFVAYTYIKFVGR